MDDDLKFVLLLYVLTCVSTVLNVVIVRQVVSFIFLSFVPGYLFLRLLKLGNLNRVQTFLFSTSLSLAFLMFLGFLVNGLGLAFNFPKPLSFVPLMISLSGVTLASFLICYRQENRKNSFKLPRVGFDSVLLVSSMILIVMLGIVGALNHNVIALEAMILGIVFLLAVILLIDKSISERIIGVAILSISFALLFHTVLISRYFIGVDIFNEFYVFRLTDIGGIWKAPGTVISYSLIDSLNSILSITVLPKIYTVILGVDGEIFFKLFYPIVFSLVPLTLYQIYSHSMEKKAALLSVFFFASTSITFYGTEPLSLCRQIVGQLFFVSCMFLIIEKRLPTWEKRVLLVVFASALVMSHYSLAYVFLFYVIVIHMVPRAWAFFWRRERVSVAHVLTLGMILVLFALTFSWYIYVSDSPLNQLSNSFHRIASLFSQDFYRVEARTQQGALSSLSPAVASSIIGLIHKILIYLELFFVGVGTIAMLIRPRKFGLNPELRLAAATSVVILGLCFLVPNFSDTLNVSRFYAIVIPFLAPFLFWGTSFLSDFIGSFLARYVRRMRRVDVNKVGFYFVASILIFTFLFQIGFVNHVTQDYPYSYSLDLDRKLETDNMGIRVTTHSIYFVDEDVVSAVWLSTFMHSGSTIYADENARTSILKSYALISDDRMTSIPNDTLHSFSYVYLKYVNVRIGLIESYNTSDFSYVLSSCDKVYSNGDSDIYFAP